MAIIPRRYHYLVTCLPYIADDHAIKLGRVHPTVDGKSCLGCLHIEQLRYASHEE